MNDFYVLNDKHEPVPAKMMEWSAFIQKDGRRVALSDLPNGYRISTVFLGIDHAFGDGGPPVLFETMIFPDGPGGEYQERFHTWDEAIAGHNSARAEALAWPSPAPKETT